jgi:hypothetical protein
VTTFERARMIIAQTLPKLSGPPEAQALAILNALLAKRIMPTTMRASTDMFVRFHAHCRFLGKETGYGYRAWYNDAIAYAESMDAWPCKLITRDVDIGGEKIAVDVSVPESSTRATNAQLLTAYQVIVDGAKHHGITLPEHVEVT